MPWALRSHPYPVAPHFRISSEKTGNKASAPPKRTANRSRLNTAKMILLLKIKRKPWETFSQILPCGGAVNGRLRIRIINIPHIINAQNAQKMVGVKPIQAMSTPANNGPQTDPNNHDVLDQVMA